MLLGSNYEWMSSDSSRMPLLAVKNAHTERPDSCADSSQPEIVTKSDDPWREKAVFSLKSKSYLLSNKGQEILE